eukprot:scaffold94157_cov19-Tisochrysis_lutea.AAC.1
MLDAPPCCPTLHQLVLQLYCLSCWVHNRWSCVMGAVQHCRLSLQPLRSPLVEPWWVQGKERKGRGCMLSLLGRCKCMLWHCAAESGRTSELVRLFIKCLAWFCSPILRHLG